MPSSQSNHPMENSGNLPEPLILFVGNSPASLRRSSVLRAAGYALEFVSTVEEALRSIRAVQFHVVVLGHAIASEHRIRIEKTIQRLRPKPRVVLLYETSIAQAEQADAVLNVNGDPEELVRTVRYLLTGQC
jgi:DNA-binding NtrC family response regulator